MLRLDRVTKLYKVGTFGGKDLLAVRDVSFDIHPGEVVSLIGESGSGKTTLGKMILRLIAITRGSITLDGLDVVPSSGADVKSYYRHVQGVFQDPFSSYNPIFKADRVFHMIEASTSRTWPARSGATKWRPRRAVGLNPADVLNKFPHQLSGGQLQRLLIARALLLDIKLLVADEIISMLDASTRIDVLNLLADLKSRGMGILFITHDLSLGNYISEDGHPAPRRRGRDGRDGQGLRQPHHPYTKMLLSSVPQLHQKWAQIEKELPAAITGRGGCLFHEAYPLAGRAPYAPADEPTLAMIEEDHFVGCFELEGEKVGRAA